MLDTETHAVAPLIAIGTHVVVNATPHSNENIPGWVVATGGDNADVLTFPGGVPMLREDCIWEGNPDIPNRMHMFEAGDCGVWRLTESEAKRRELEERMNAIESTMAQLLADNASCNCNDADETPEKKKTRRGA